MSWSFLTRLLEEIHQHSTYLGKLWFTTFLIFRIVLTAVGGESIYYDEQSKFVCNTQQPGCENVCYDSFAPLSHVRFWIFQIIVVATPSILYLGFAIHRIRRSEDSPAYKKPRRTPLIHRGPDREAEEAENDQEEDPILHEEEEFDHKTSSEDEDKKKDNKRHDGRRMIRVDGLMKAYVLQLILRTMAEVGFLFGQYMMYGLEVIPRFECTRYPCPHRVDCFISRPTEKTIFLYVMYAMSGLGLVLDVAEMWHLGMGALGDALRGRQTKHDQRSVEYHRGEEQLKVLPSYGSYEDYRPENVPSAPPHYNCMPKPAGQFPQRMANGKPPQMQTSNVIEIDKAPGIDLSRLQDDLRVMQQRLELMSRVGAAQEHSRVETPASDSVVTEQNRANTAHEKHHHRAAEEFKTGSEKGSTISSKSNPPISV